MDLNDFIRERNEALFSLDKKKILNYARKYGQTLSENPIVFWGSIYKAILNVNNAPEDKKEIAREWLKKHNMKETLQ